MERDKVSANLSEKVNEFQLMSAPLAQAIKELEFAQTLLRARCESDIAATVPALGALSEILDISSLDLLMAQDRREFLTDAIIRRGLTPEDVGLQMRSLIASPESREELKALGIGEQISS